MSAFLGKTCTFLQSNNMKTVLKIFQLRLSFYQLKGQRFINKRVRIMNHLSKMRLPERYSNVIILHYDIIINFLEVILFLLSSSDTDIISCQCHYPANIQLFKVNNRNTRKRCENMFKVYNKDTRTTLNIFHTFVQSFYC